MDAKGAKHIEDQCGEAKIQEDKETMEAVFEALHLTECQEYYLEDASRTVTVGNVTSEVGRRTFKDEKLGGSGTIWDATDLKQQQKSLSKKSYTMRT